MTSKKIVLIAEGGSDLSSYDKICKHAFGNDDSYLVLKASNFRGISNGKKGVITLFGKATTKGPIAKVIFIVDKDIDDEMGCLVPHKNLLYTECYNIENEIVRGADLISSLSVVCGETRDTIVRCLNKHPNYVEALPGRHLSWVAFCIVVRSSAMRVRCGNYGVNKPLFLNHSPRNIFRNKSTKPLCQVAKRDLGISQAQFISLFEKASLKADHLYAIGKIDLVFNGKWYFPLIADWISEINMVSGAIMAGFEKRLRDAMVSHIQPTAPIVLRLKNAASAVC